MNQESHSGNAFFWAWILLAPPMALIGAIITFFSRLAGNIHGYYQVGTTELLFFGLFAVLAWSALYPCMQIRKHVGRPHWVWWLALMVWVLPGVAAVNFILFSQLFR